MMIILMNDHDFYSAATIKSIFYNLNFLFHFD